MSVAAVCLKSWKRISGIFAFLKVALKCLVRFLGSWGVPIVEGKISPFSTQRSSARILSLCCNLSCFLNLSSALFEAMDHEYFHALVIDTEWEKKFELVWRKQGERIIRFQDNPDGIYFIDDGTVNVLDREDRLIKTLTGGDVFGEMSYFPKRGQRSASVIAASDLVLRRISGEDLKTLPVIQKIFKKIACKRIEDK